MKIFISAQAALEAKEDGLYLILTSGIKHVMINLSEMNRTSIGREVVRDVLEAVRRQNPQDRFVDTRLAEGLRKDWKISRLRAALKYYATPGTNGDVARKALGL